MVSFIFLVIILIVCLALLFGYKTLNFIPEREIEKRYNRGDVLALRLFSALKYKKEIEGLIIIKLIILIAIALLIIARSLPIWFGVLALVSFLSLSLFLIGKKPSKFILSFGSRVIRIYVKFVRKFNSYLPHKTLSSIKKDNRHSGIFDIDDLDELIRRQLEQADNRIIEEDLKQISNVLSLRRMYVDQMMIRIKNFPVIKTNDLVTPVVIDEIHKIKGSYLPVFDKDDNVVGFVNKNRLGLGSEGRISDYIDFITEKVDYTDNLYQVIEKLIQDNSYSLPVYNQGILVGVIDLGTILKWLLLFNESLT